MARTSIKVECVAWWESDVGTAVDIEDLILWAQTLPPTALIHIDVPNVHNRLHLKATWEEVRPVRLREIVQVEPTRRGFSLKRS